mmetsp:Transcript_62195/g.148379  ORF Transcript_62195/g.148379 Transcript_62195/m.148379 type:complete len:191 (+) Transcript_62195:71-643(+)
MPTGATSLAQWRSSLERKKQQLDEKVVQAEAKVQETRAAREKLLRNDAVPKLNSPSLACLLGFAVECDCSENLKAYCAPKPSSLDAAGNPAIKRGGSRNRRGYAHRLLEAWLIDMLRRLDCLQEQQNPDNLSLEVYTHMVSELEALNAEALEIACREQYSPALEILARGGKLLEELGVLWVRSAQDVQKL